MLKISTMKMSCLSLMRNENVAWESAWARLGGSCVARALPEAALQVKGTFKSG